MDDLSQPVGPTVALTVAVAMAVATAVAVAAAVAIAIDEEADRRLTGEGLAEQALQAGGRATVAG